MSHCLEANLKKKECLQKFILMVSDTIHVAILLNVVAVIAIKSKSMFDQNVVLDFTLNVLKVIMKMQINRFNIIDMLYYTTNIPEKLCIFSVFLKKNCYIFHSFFV